MTLPLQKEQSERDKTKIKRIGSNIAIIQNFFERSNFEKT